MVVSITPTTVVCMYLVMMVTTSGVSKISQGEAIVLPKVNLSLSFSKMKHMKNRLRPTMTMDRLTNVALISVEYLILRDVVSISFRLLLTDEVVVATFSHYPDVDSRSYLSLSHLRCCGHTHRVVVSISSHQL